MPLINCVAYREGRRLADIDLRDVHTYLAQPGTFVWVALHEPTQSELATMQEEFDLHDLAIEDAGHTHEEVARAKIEEYGEALFVVLNTAEFTPTDEIKIGEMGVFVGRNYILSVRRRTERGIARRLAAPPSRRREGREPMLRRSITSIGVAARK